jgi:hypothetical protein
VDLQPVGGGGGSLESVTLAAWVSVDPALPEGTHDVIQVGTSESRALRLVRVAGGVKVLGASNGPAGAAVATGVLTLGFGRWHHIAMTRDSASVTVYVDGRADARAHLVQGNLDALLRPGAGPESVSDPGGLNAVRVGGSGLPGGPSLMGLVDEATVHVGALSDPEVALLSDTTPPSITWDSLLGAGWKSFTVLNVPPAPSCSAADRGLPVPCTVTGYSTELGAHTLTATATDEAGNAASATRYYTVGPARPDHTVGPARPDHTVGPARPDAG